MQDDLEEEGEVYHLSDLRWGWDADKTSNTFLATLYLREGDSGPLGAVGPGLAIYSREGVHGEPRLEAIHAG